MQIWDTELAGHRDRRSYWAKAVREAIYELEFEAEDPAIHASLSQMELGAIRLSSVSITSGHQITRSAAAIRRNRNPHFNMNYVRSGAFNVSHCGHELWLGPGDIVLLDNRQPYRVWSNGETSHVSVHIPVEWLQSMMAAPESGVAQVIRAGSPWQAALVGMLEDAPRLPDGFIGANELGSRQIAGALALALGPVLSSNSQHTRLLLLRAQELITVRYHEHELDAESIAQALGISVRYVYRLFSQEGTTVGREISRIRLEHAALKMLNPQFAELSIAEISWRCGFSDPSYFSKCFRAHYRKSPGVYRANGRAEARLDN